MKNHIIDKNVIAELDAFACLNKIQSMTSTKYRNDIAYFIANNHDRGDTICEVGSYKGGLSIVLAYLAKIMEKKLVICEIDVTCAESVGTRLDSLGLKDSVDIHTSDFASFAASGHFPSNCILTIIDANHIYEEAKINFMAFKSVDRNSYAVAFHDYGLRDIDARMGIWRAVNDVYPHKNICYIGDNTLFCPCENHTDVAKDKTYFQGSEGALIILNSELSKKEQKVLTFCHDALGAWRRAHDWARKTTSIAGRLVPKNLSEPVSAKQPPPTDIPGGLRLVHGKYGHFLVLEHDTGVGKAILETGVWADEHVQLFQSLLPEGGTAFDVGANIGHHSVALAGIAGESGRVFAFEPQTTIFEILCANSAINSCRNIVPLHVLVGESPGSLPIPDLDYAQNENFGAMCVENKPEGHSHTGDTLKISLDSLLDEPRYGITRVDFIKIDVQTFELYVLMGAKKLLKTHRPALLVEISPYWMKRVNNYDYREIYTFLELHEYELFDTSLRRLPTALADTETMAQTVEWDIVAIHRKSLLIDKFKKAI